MLGIMDKLQGWECRIDLSGPTRLLSLLQQNKQLWSRLQLWSQTNMITRCQYTSSGRLPQLCLNFMHIIFRIIERSSSWIAFLFSSEYFSWWCYFQWQHFLLNSRFLKDCFTCMYSQFKIEYQLKKMCEFIF